MNTISLEIPSFLGLSLKMEDAELVAEVKKMAILKMYELGKVSSSVGAKVLNISRYEFLEMLGKYKISIFPELSKEELIEEINAI
ncbi:MAG: UPF0175 family protein [Leptospiraceae bacterium]|nr:UPF0175 family protein [Leptospiraceae bacterium]